MASQFVTNALTGIYTSDIFFGHHRDSSPFPVCSSDIDLNRYISRCLSRGIHNVKSQRDMTIIHILVKL